MIEDKSRPNPDYVPVNKDEVVGYYLDLKTGERTPIKAGDMELPLSFKYLNRSEPHDHAA